MFHVHSVITILVTCSVLSVAAAAARDATAFYVAPNGNDAWSGTERRPFASLSRARDAMRELKQGGLSAPVSIRVRGGAYNLSEPLVLTPQDSGTEGCRITWEAHRGERVVIRGCRKVTGWAKWKDGIHRADL